MSTEFQPGTVAIATVRGVEGVRVMRCGGAEQQGFWWTPEYAGDVLGNEPQWRQHEDREVTDIRPLVVLDLGDYDNRAHTYLRNLANDDHEALGGGPTPRSKLAHLIADQIEAQVKPPRIPEPGLWGVVEAKPGTNDEAPRQQFVRYPDDNPEGHWESKWYGSMKWDELIDPVLIREGVTS